MEQEEHPPLTEERKIGLRRSLRRLDAGRWIPGTHRVLLGPDCTHPEVIAIKKAYEKDRKEAQKKKALPPVLDRAFKKNIRPLRSKPDPKKRDKASASRGPRPSELQRKKAYIENGWHCCGLYKVATISADRNTRKVALEALDGPDKCGCGKTFNNRLHAKRHIDKCKKNEK